MNIPRESIISALEELDGLCLDTPEERALVADHLVAALKGAQYMAVRVEGGLITGASLWPTPDKAEQDARVFLTAADMETDDAAVLKLGYGQVEVTLTSKQILGDGQ